MTGKIYFDLQKMFKIENNVIHGFRRLYESKTGNVGQVIFDTLKQQSNHVAQIDVDNNKQMTFDEMREPPIRCALWMQKQGIDLDDVVVICTPNRMDTYIPLVAIFYVDAILNAWNHDVSLHSARNWMKLLTPKIIFACRDSMTVLTEAAKLENINVKFIVFEDNENTQTLRSIMEEQSDEEVKNFLPRNKKTLKDTAAIYFSSGSTGLPKGVMCSEEALLSNIYLRPSSTKSIVTLSYSTLYWISSISIILNFLLNKDTRLMHTLRDMKDLCQVIEKYKVNSVMLTPATLNELVKFECLEKYDFKSLALITTGGSKISEKVFENLQKKLPNVNIYQGYGMTEAGGGISIQSEQRSSYNSIGFLVWSGQAKIIDVTTNEILGPNEPGEMCIKGPCIMNGYYKNPEATKQAIDQDGWLHTGDLCYYNTNGEFFMIDRLKEILKYRNYQISPAEIEDILMTHPAVLQAAVVPVPHDIDVERPFAFVKISPGKKVTKEELIELSSVLGDSKKLRGGIEFLEEIPKTASGKYAKGELRMLAKKLITS